MSGGPCHKPQTALPPFGAKGEDILQHAAAHALPGEVFLELGGVWGVKLHFELEDPRNAWKSTEKKAAGGLKPKRSITQDLYHFT